MTSIKYRWLEEAELARIGEIDRSELVFVGYERRDGSLVSLDVEWDVGPFLEEGEGEHTLAEQVRFCRTHLEKGARCRGAFANDRLVGIGLLTPEIRPCMAQIAYLVVSKDYRRKGIAASLVGDLIEVAVNLEQDCIYVSATPSESAVAFYSRLGFSPVSDPLPELFSQEPVDIHMIKRL